MLAPALFDCTSSFYNNTLPCINKSGVYYYASEPAQTRGKRQTLCKHCVVISDLHRLARNNQQRVTDCASVCSLRTGFYKHFFQESLSHSYGYFLIWTLSISCSMSKI